MEIQQEIRRNGWYHREHLREEAGDYGDHGDNLWEGVYLQGGGCGKVALRKQFGYGIFAVYALEKGMGRIMKRKSMGLAIFGMSVFLLFPHRQITYAS